MAVDFQVCFPSAAVQLTSVTVTQQDGIALLDIFGEDFRSVDEVLINDVPSPSVVGVSNTRLLAQIPPEVLAQPLASVRVTSRRLVMTDRSYLRFQVGRTPSKVTGILKLMQLFLKLLFTTPGTDIFAPGLGAGALRNIGSTVSHHGGNNVVSDFVLAVSSTQRQIIALQGRDATLPRDERLLAAKVTRAAYSKQESALIVSVELTSQAGRAAVANVLV